MVCRKWRNRVGKGSRGGWITRKRRIKKEVEEDREGGWRQRRRTRREEE